MPDSTISTGLPGLDRILKGLLPGDNIVWQVDSIEEYLLLVRPYAEGALRNGKHLVYFRFARHPALLSEDSGADIRLVRPEAGYETFLAEIHKTIEEAGKGTFYVFDCLSELAADWYSDRMLGNFFMLTCPYLFDLETITYFALFRNHHSLHAINPITETTQLFLDVYSHSSGVYIHPLKVQQRYSPTMYMLHAWKGDEFVPVTRSTITSEILTSLQRSPLESASYQMDVWNRLFLQAAKVLDSIQKGELPPEAAEDHKRRLLRMALSRDERVLALAENHLTLSDVLDVGQRMVGTGLIGGKSVGMLLAQAILKRGNPRWVDLLEVHDSFYIASDVFYTFLVRNGCWWVRQKQRDPKDFLEGSERARQSILRGTFPDSIVQAVTNMLDYFGQCPIIVRSSSLLEDNFGNSFSGKYESVFCPNQGSRDQRLADFLSTVRRIYASTMSEKALIYRARRGLLDRDEQMALLVMRVSGDLYGKLFYPQIAGVGFSFNPYSWTDTIDREAGLLRLVFGLGTRAVDRADDDYTRLVALNAPEMRPEATSSDVRQYAQRKVDVLDLEANQLVSVEFPNAISPTHQLPLETFASRDPEIERYIRETGRKEVFPYVLTFNHLLRKTGFVTDMREMLSTLQRAYRSPVDVEFTANFSDDGRYKISLLQCRPFQVQMDKVVTEPPKNILHQDLVLQTHGAIIGQSRLSLLDRIIYVVPTLYGQLPIKERYSVARTIGQLTHHESPTRPDHILLLGPGRWGTSTPSLGVPVSFAEINTVSVLCEVVAMREDLVPDVSLGTHFFNDLVETNILYMALFPDREGNFLNEELLMGLPNRLPQLLPNAPKGAEAVRVLDSADFPAGKRLHFHANTIKQEALCYLGARDAS